MEERKNTRGGKQKGLTIPAEQHRRGSDTPPLGHLDHGLRAHHGPARAPEGAVRHDVDALLAAQVDDLLLAEGRVVLDLVDGGGDGRVGEELVEVALGVLSGC